MPTSSLLRMGGREIVVDCGLGVTRALCDQGMQLKDLSAVFVTHLHSDHYLELGPLIHTAWTAGLSTPVTVWGPEGLARYWEAFVASMAADIDLRIADEGRPDLRGLVAVRVLGEGPSRVRMASRCGRCGCCIRRSSTASRCRSRARGSVSCSRGIPRISRRLRISRARRGPAGARGDAGGGAARARRAGGERGRAAHGASGAVPHVGGGCRADRGGGGGGGACAPSPDPVGRSGVDGGPLAGGGRRRTGAGGFMWGGTGW